MFGSRRGGSRSLPRVAGREARRLVFGSGGGGRARTVIAVGVLVLIWLVITRPTQTGAFLGDFFHLLVK